VALALLGMGVLATVCGAAVALPVILGRADLQPWAAALLLAAMVAVYGLTLSPAARLLASRRERVIAELRGRE
jgi:NhaP-type Na+/H+ or K+/H+ antiporter